MGNASTPESISARNALPASEPFNNRAGYIINNAERKALGLLPANATGNDGDLFIGTNIGAGINWSFGTGTPSANDYSFSNGMEHELSELMGRTTQLGNIGFPFQTPIDLLRYTAPGVIDMGEGATGVYFSIDGGVTVGKVYNSQVGADVQDWASGVGGPDPYDAYGTPGTYATLSAIDQHVMTTLGWQLADVAVPEASSYAMLLAGLAGIGAVVRRRQPATA